MQLPQLETFTKRQRDNYLLNLWEMQKQRQVLSSLPISIQLPFETACNANCIFCAQRIKHESPVADKFDLRHYLIYRKPLHSALTIGFGMVGEPFMYPAFTNVLRFMQDNFRAAKISFSTNGILLNKKIASMLGAAKKLHLNISVNAADHLTYLKVMGVDAFSKVIANIRLVADVQRKNKGLTLSLSYVLMKQNIAGVPDFINLAAAFNIKEVDLFPLIITDSNLNKCSLKEDALGKTLKILRRAARIARHNNIKLSCLRLDKGTHSWNMFNKRLTCHFPWQDFKIRKNGNIYICCYSTIPAGNIFKQDMNEIWNGKVYRAYRMTVNTRRLLSNCAACPMKNLNAFSFRNIDSANLK